MHFFCRIQAVPRTGRRTIRSPELSKSKESPADSCNSSLTGLGKTTRPALSTVKVVFMAARAIHESVKKLRNQSDVAVKTLANVS